jgi:hypothetical protein
MRSYLVGLFVVLAACTPAVGGDDGDDGVPLAPTWYQDVAPIVAGACQGCHVDRGIAPFPLTTYNEAMPAAAQMADMVDSGLMPPFGAQPGSAGGCTPAVGWKDDPTLTAAEKETVRRWADAGAPAGDAANPAELPAPPDRNLAGVTHTIAPRAGWTTSGDTDQFMCLVYDPQLTADRWLTGLQFLPTDAAVVHHAGAFVDESRMSEGLAGPDGVYECFGGVGIPTRELLGAYTPGMLPFEALPGTGIRVPAGALIVVQYHYHPLGAAQPVYDATELAMRLTATPPTRPHAWEPMGNADSPPQLQPGPADQGGVQFRVPAGIAGHTEEMRFGLPVPDGVEAAVWSVFPHMHYVGTRMVVELERANGGRECLIDAGRYDFNWQRIYNYAGDVAAMPRVRAGDTVVMRCTYDNTVQNPNVLRALQERGLSAPIDVFLGEQTLDEMCVLLLGATLP